MKLALEQSSGILSTCETRSYELQCFFQNLPFSVQQLSEALGKNVLPRILETFLSHQSAQNPEPTFECNIRRPFVIRGISRENNQKQAKSTQLQKELPLGYSFLNYDDKARALYPFPSSPTLASDSSPAPRFKSLCSSPSLEEPYGEGSFGLLVQSELSLVQNRQNVFAILVLFFTFLSHLTSSGRYQLILPPAFSLYFLDTF